MGNLPSTVSCDPATPALNPITGGLYSIGSGFRLFYPACLQDTTGPVLSITTGSLYDCVQSCGPVPACHAVSWRDGTCYQKSALGQTVIDTGVSTFIAFDSGPTCPSSDGNVYHSSGNHGDFTIMCGTDYPGVGDLGGSRQPSFQSCVDVCSVTSGCVAAVYDGAQCFLKSAIGVPSTGVSQMSAVLVGTTPITPPSTNGPDPHTYPISCPSSSSVSYTSPLQPDASFDVSCGTDYFGGDFLSIETDTLQKCLDACASHPECVALAYTGVGCYMKSTLNTPNVDPSFSVIGAKRVSPITNTPPSRARSLSHRQLQH